MSGALIGGILATLGACAGAGLTYLLQSKAADRAERFAIGERLRVDRVEAFSSFAAALIEARRAQLDRWYQASEAGRGSDAYLEAKANSHLYRTAAWQAYYRTQLISDSAGLTGIANEALDAIGDLHKAQTREDLDNQAADVRTLVTRFVKDARSCLDA